MNHTLIFDCEFLTAEGSPSRFWCGPYDPDPVVVQIGIVKIGLDADFAFLDTLRLYIKPRDRHGNELHLDPFFTNLTGISQNVMDREGSDLADALARVKNFAAGERLWSWGKDELNMLAISCFIEGIKTPLPATQFGNACELLIKAGMPYEDIKKTRSNQLSAYFQIKHPPLRIHDAMDDALSVAYVIQHLLRQRLLNASVLQ